MSFVSKPKPWDRTVPLSVLLKLNSALKRSIFSRKFYQEINDKVLSSSSTVDTNLYFICYFTLLLSSILNNKHNIRRFLKSQLHNVLKLMKTSALTLFGKDLSQSSNKFVARTFSDFKEEKETESAQTEETPSNLAIHLKSISSYLSDVRIFARLTDSIKYMPWIIDEYHAFVDPKAKAPKFDRFINLLQALNCIVLELLENAGWLTDHNWVGTNDNNYWCIETYIWCSRVWGAYLLIEIIELFRRTPVSKWNHDWRIKVFKQAVQLPMVAHWSLYNGCLTPFWVGLCGSCTSWFNFRDMWMSLDI